jgi:hypothetical protein
MCFQHSTLPAETQQIQITGVDEETPRQRARRFLLDIGFGTDGKPPRHVRLGDLRDVVARNPDGASSFVLLTVEADDPPSVYRQLAVSIAILHRMETGDDTLEAVLNTTAWIADVRVPKFLDSDGAEIRVSDTDPDPFATLANDPVRGLEVARADADAGNVAPLVEQFTFDGKTSLRIGQMVSTWGSWVITFPYEDDERPAIVIPAVRRYIARVNDAVPHFPSYLDFTPELGMFWLYFGSLADLEAFDGQQLDIGHASIQDAVIHSGCAMRAAATRAGRPHEPLWRALLAIYPRETSDELMARLAACK